MPQLLQRTSSSPSLSDKQDWECQFDGYAYDEDDEFYVIGDRVYLDKYRPASVAYFGEVEFASGDWIGLVLDQPTGNHNGKVHGREYFQCAPFHGTFVRPHRVSRMSDSALGSSSRGTSRAATPLPTFERLLPSTSGLRSKSPGSVGSYYYDDDYKQDQRPSVASLARKLKSIDEQCQGGPHMRPYKAGILKSNQVANNSGSEHSHQSRPQSSIGARMEELSRRLRAASTSPTRGRHTDQATVFNFRPKREQLTTNHEQWPQTSGSTPDGRRSVNLSSEVPRKGDRVLVRTERGDMPGILRFMGDTQFATGEWAGIELDRAEGKNDGSVLGVRYFHCPRSYGLFVPATRVRKAPSDGFQSTGALNCREPPVFNRMKATVWSPPPSQFTGRGRHQESPYRSASAISSSSGGNYSPSSAYSSSNTNTNYDYSSQKNLPEFDYDPYNKLLSDYHTHSGTYHFGAERPKFDDKDIEIQLKKSLSKPKTYSTKSTSHNFEPVRPKAVQYTFTSSKYDGNPIARKTLVYE